MPVFIETRGGKAAESEMARQVRISMERWRARIAPASVALFARQLSTMISVGLPLVRSLRSIARDHHDKKLKAIIGQVADDVQKGDALSAALGKHPQAFDEVFVSLVHTGEVSGTLDESWTRPPPTWSVPRCCGSRSRRRYPTFVFTFAVVVLIAMIVKIIPMFASIYDRFRVPLPLPTKILLTISQVVTDNLLVVTGLTVVAAFMLWFWSQTLIAVSSGSIRPSSTCRSLIDPDVCCYQFARTLGILTTSGTQIPFALKVMRPVPGNKLLEQGIDFVRGQVEQGMSLARSMEASRVFPEMLVQMTATGEETGQLDAMLMRTADFYEQRVSAAVDGMSSLVEPIAIVVLGLVIGVMLIALYLPIFSLGQAMRSGLGQ